MEELLEWLQRGAPSSIRGDFGEDLGGLLLNLSSFVVPIRGDPVVGEAGVDEEGERGQAPAHWLMKESTEYSKRRS